MLGMTVGQGGLMGWLLWGMGVGQWIGNEKQQK